MANINEYKSSLELCSSNLINLLNGLQQKTLLDGNVDFTQGSITFQSCDIFNWIKKELVGECSTQNGVLDDICEILKCILLSDTVKNCELKKQLIKALQLCECLAQAIKHTNCYYDMEQLIGRLFCLLVQIIISVLSIIAKIISLLILCRGNCGNFFTGCNNGEVLSSFCKCLICDLENELDQIENLIDELNQIAVMFAICRWKKCKCDRHYLNCTNYRYFNKYDYNNYKYRKHDYWFKKI